MVDDHWDHTDDFAQRKEFFIEDVRSEADLARERVEARRAARLARRNNPDYGIW